MEKIYLYARVGYTIFEYVGYIEKRFSRFIFHSFNEYENVPHFGKVAKKEGIIHRNSIWFKEQKTNEEIMNIFISEYKHRIDVYQQNIESIIDTLDSFYTNDIEIERSNDALT